MESALRAASKPPRWLTTDRRRPSSRRQVGATVFRGTAATAA